MFNMRKANTIRHFVNVFESMRNKSTTTKTFAKNLEHLKKPAQSYNIPFSSDLTLELQKETEQFMLVFPDVIRDLTQFNDATLPKHELRMAEKHFERALDYNVPHGKKIRGLTVVIAYKDLMANERLTPENIRLAQLLGWCVEVLQSVFLTSDDIVDRSEIRRGKPCWYKVDDVKSVAINDILMIENGCYSLLKKYFGHLPCYVNIVELMHKTALTTFIGQSLDFQMSNNAAVPQFTVTKHRCIADCKTSHFAFYTPIALPMMLAGYNDEKVFDDVKDIAFEIGHYYQVQNDFLDCFGEAGVLKKPGTDIQDGKCTWLGALAMEIGNDQQKETMKKCYGIDDASCVNNVKKVYDDLDFPGIYTRYEEQTYNNIKQQIQQTLHADKLLQSVMIDSLNRTFNKHHPN